MHLALEVRRPAVGEVDHGGVGAPSFDLRDHAVGVPASAVTVQLHGQMKIVTVIA